jgi:hypothetical protein
MIHVRGRRRYHCALSPDKAGFRRWWTFFADRANAAKATWLSDTEKSLLQARLEQECASERKGATPRTILRELFSGEVMLLSLAYFELVVSLNATTHWTP